MSVAYAHRPDFQYFVEGSSDDGTDLEADVRWLTTLQTGSSPR